VTFAYFQETNNDHQNPKDQNEEIDEESSKKKRHKNNDHQSGLKISFDEDHFF